MALRTVAVLMLLGLWDVGQTRPGEISTKMLRKYRAQLFNDMCERCSRVTGRSGCTMELMIHCKGRLARTTIPWT